ncbi:MAG TPA: AAA family ATPase, partial [Fimbriimonadaceae bacterium]|nr:AAA family ATPase [Fimbriimonadaceae bacterium]
MPPKDSIENRLIVHELPSAPKFIGRDPELESLRDFWSGSDQVVSLIGLGGAGKTALADRFLNWVESNDAPDWLLVWSFYDDPDANAFLETLYRFLTGDQQAEVKGSGWFHLLREELSGNKRVLLILDGLERVQRPITDASGIYGDLEDPLLKGLLTRLASSGGRTKAVITSRFPVATVEPYLGRGYQVLNVEQLPNSAVKELMALRGIHLDDLSLARFVSTFGSHALSLDLLAGAIENYFDRDI